MALALLIVQLCELTRNNNGGIYNGGAGASDFFHSFGGYIYMHYYMKEMEKTVK